MFLIMHISIMTVIVLIGALVSSLAVLGMFINGFGLMFGAGKESEKRIKFYKGVGSYLVFVSVWIVVLILFVLFGGLSSLFPVY